MIRVFCERCSAGRRASLLLALLHLFKAHERVASLTEVFLFNYP